MILSGLEPHTYTPLTPLSVKLIVKFNYLAILGHIAQEPGFGTQYYSFTDLVLPPNASYNYNRPEVLERLKQHLSLSEHPEPHCDYGLKAIDCAPRQGFIKVLDCTTSLACEDVSGTSSHPPLMPCASRSEYQSSQPCNTATSTRPLVGRIRIPFCGSRSNASKAITTLFLHVHSTLLHTPQRLVLTQTNPLHCYTVNFNDNILGHVSGSV